MAVDALRGDPQAGLSSRHPGRSREAPGNRRPRGMVIHGFRARTEPGLQAVWPLISHLRGTFIPNSGQGLGLPMGRTGIWTVSHGKIWEMAPTTAQNPAITPYFRFGSLNINRTNKLFGE